MNKILHIILISLFSLTIISCSSSSDGGSKSTDNTTTDNTTTDNTTTDNTTTTCDNTTTTTTSSDTTKPQITCLSFSPSSIDTSSSSQPVTATISITDDTALPDGSYLNVEVRLISPSQNQFIDFTGYTGSEETGGTSVSRTFKSTSTFTQGSESGTWTIQYANVTDKVGNSKSYTASELTALGFSTTISNTAASSDTTKPQITGLSFSPSSIDTSSSSQPVTATISITDDTALPDGSYLNVEVRLISPSQNQFIDFTGYTGSEETGGTSVSRTFKSTSTFTQGSESGTWTIQYANVTDKVGNSKSYTASELTALGFSTTISN